MPRVLSDTSQELLDMIPVEIQRDATLRAVYDVAGYELDILNGYVDKLLANAIPSTADDWLYIWEQLFGIVVQDPSQTIDQRRATVIAYMQRIVSTGSGLDWEAGATQQLGTQWTYKTHIPGDASSPPPNNVYVFLPYSAGSTGARQAEKLLRTITPANQVLLVTYGNSFILDASQLDHDLL